VISKPAQPRPQVPVSAPVKPATIQPRKPVIALPRKETAVLFQEKIDKERSLLALIDQIKQGCGNTACQNVECCLSANKNLHSSLGLAQVDKASIIQAALALQIEDKYQICEK